MNNKLYLLAFTAFFVSSEAHVASDKQLSAQQTMQQKATAIVAAALDNLVNNDIISAEHLHKILESDMLINPVTEYEAGGADNVFVYSKQLDNLLERDKQCAQKLQIESCVNLADVKAWAIKKLETLEKTKQDRREAHENTRELHHEMQFVELPPGKYVSEIDHQEFEILDGIEIQDTPVTQFQWEKIMGDNPSIFAQSDALDDVIEEIETDL